MRKSYFAVGALCLAGLGIASDASAVRQNVAVGGAYVPRRVDLNNWENDGAAAFATVKDTASNTNFHYARTSIPIAPIAFQALSSQLVAFGGSSGSKQVCFALYSVSPSGVMSAFTGSACTTGAGSDQTLSRSINVNTNHAAVADIAGQNLGVAKYLQFTY